MMLLYPFMPFLRIIPRVNEGRHQVVKLSLANEESYKLITIYDHHYILRIISEGSDHTVIRDLIQLQVYNSIPIKLDLR